MFDMPPTRYARSDDLDIAYQVVGDGPVDIVLVMGSFWHLEHQWTDPELVRAIERLASIGRLIMFDKRGTGVSDRLPRGELPTLEQRMDDVRAVMDAVGSERAVVCGESEGGPMSILFATTYPDRCQGLVLYGSFASLARDEEQPWGVAVDDQQKFLDWIDATWGQRLDLELVAPTWADDPTKAEWMATMQRLTGPPRVGIDLMRMVFETDVRHLLPSVRVPTLVLHRRGDRMCPVEGGRLLAERIPGARYVESAGSDHVWWIGGDEVLDEIETFITGVRPVAHLDRVLTTVLFTDIVGSTTRAAAMGDAAWHRLLQRHDELMSRHVARFRGRVVKSTGDGVLATFDGPARAVSCAVTVGERLRSLGLETRAGLHTGEVELGGDDIRGLAVHIAARIEQLAEPGEVLVSSTVRDLVAGSGLAFEARGEHRLKGVPDPWRLYAVSTD